MSCIRLQVEYIRLREFPLFIQWKQVVENKHFVRDDDVGVGSIFEGSRIEKKVVKSEIYIYGNESKEASRKEE